MPKFIAYFGYGTNKDADMMAAMVGRKNLKGEPGMLPGYEVCIQKSNQIRNSVLKDAPFPVSPRELITKGFGGEFELYVIRENPKGEAYGTIWYLTAEEMELVNKWELVDFGMYELTKATAENNKGEKVPIVTQALLKEPKEIDRPVAGKDYEPYLVAKDYILKKADDFRKNFWEKVST